MPDILRDDLVGYDVVGTREMGWDRTGNGELLALADGAFDVLLTIDRKMAYQQNIGRLVTRLAVLVLVVPNNREETVRSLLPQILDAPPMLAPRAFTRFVHPDSRRER